MSSERKGRSKRKAIPAKGASVGSAGSSASASDEDEYPCKYLLGHRLDADGKKQYLVRWDGAYADSKYDTWEPEGNIHPELIADFETYPWYYRFPGSDGKDIWREFTPADNLKVNEAYLAWCRGKGPGMYELERPGKSVYKYAISFGAMTQQNLTHSDHTIRSLHRGPL